MCFIHLSSPQWHGEMADVSHEAPWTAPLDCCILAMQYLAMAREAQKNSKTRSKNIKKLWGSTESTVYDDLKSEIWKRATLATLGLDFHWTVADRCSSPKTLRSWQSHGRPGWPERFWRVVSRGSKGKRNGNRNGNVWESCSRTFGTYGKAYESVKDLSWSNHVKL